MNALPACREAASVLLAHPRLASGGSEHRVLWSAQALRNTHRVAIATVAPWSLDRLNLHAGTDLQATDLRLLTVPRWQVRGIGHTDALRGALLARYLRSIGRRFDLCISGYNPIDFGRPAIQCIADLSFDEALREHWHPAPRGPGGALRWRPALRRGYLGLVRAIAGSSRYDGRHDWVIANSHWTAGVLAERFGWACERVIYPPVGSPPTTVPWDRRDNGFVVVGRISPEKRIERLIEILARVRATGHAVRLHLVGAIGSDAYGRRVHERIAANAAWCVAEGFRTGADKWRLLQQHRFALHGCTGEAFGIAVAEAVQAGCLPFVPTTGGPAEIVGTAALTFATDDEAVAKILAVLREPVRAAQLRAWLGKRSGRFSAARFSGDMRELVQAWQVRQ